jgi:glycosyltransferase involved in cell wall biosynthesis
LDAILAQTFADFELIISDNASTDRTREICRAYAGKDSRLRYFRHEKNLGAGGEYFKWAAHDDLIAPAFLEKCVEILDRHPEIVLCFDAFGYIDAEGKLLRRAPGNLSLLASNSDERLRILVEQQNKSTDIFLGDFYELAFHSRAGFGAEIKKILQNRKRKMTLG